MRRLAVITLVALTAAVGASAAPAQDSTARSTASEISVLRGQVRALQKQVKALQKAHKETRDIAIGALGWGICLGAITADAFQGTWAIIDQFGQASQGKTYIGAQPTVDDQNICREFANIFRSTAVPPTMSVFSALYALLKSSAAFRADAGAWTR